MYFHIIIAIICWTIGLSFPSISDKYLVTLMVVGFFAFLLFLKELLSYVNLKFLKEVEEAEQEEKSNLDYFKGKFVMIRDEDSPFSDEFTYMIFNNGQIEIPLFCRNLRVIQKAAQATSELMVYYKNHILVSVDEIEE